jgi:hypothetical protein
MQNLINQNSSSKKKPPFSHMQNLTKNNQWRTLVDDFRTRYRQQIIELHAANWNWVLPLVA